MDPLILFRAKRSKLDIIVIKRLDNLIYIQYALSGMYAWYEWPYFKTHFELVP